MSRLSARELLRRSLATGIPVAVTYLGADAMAHYRFVLAYQDPAGLARQARFDLTNPDDVLAVEPVR